MIAPFIFSKMSVAKIDKKGNENMLFLFKKEFLV